MSHPSRESEGVVPRLFTTEDLNKREGAGFGTFRPTVSQSEGGYRMTYEEEMLCKMVIPYQVESRPSVLSIAIANVFRRPRRSPPDPLHLVVHLLRLNALVD